MAESSRRQGLKAVTRQDLRAVAATRQHSWVLPSRGSKWDLFRASQRRRCQRKRIIRPDSALARYNVRPFSAAVFHVMPRGA
jgi:hypothetical protein